MAGLPAAVGEAVSSLAVRGDLCFSFEHTVFRCHWPNPRLAMRRLGQGPLCGNCVEGIQ